MLENQDQRGGCQPEGYDSLSGLPDTPEPLAAVILKNGGEWCYDIRATNKRGCRFGRKIAEVNRYLRDVGDLHRVLAAAPEMLRMLRIIAAWNPDAKPGDKQYHRPHEIKTLAVAALRDVLVEPECHDITRGE